MGVLYHRREVFVRVRRDELSPTVHDWLSNMSFLPGEQLVPVAAIADRGWLVQVPTVVDPVALLDDRLPRPMPVKLFALLEEARSHGANLVLIGEF